MVGLTSLALSGALAAALATASPLSARIPAAPRLVDATFSGNGCPQGSPTTLRGSGNAITMSFPNMFAALSDDNVVDRSKRCGLIVNVLDGVPGWALAVKSVSGSGSLYATEGVELAFLTTLFWAQNPTPVTQRTNIISLAGPRTAVLQPVSFEDTFDTAGTTFVSRCVTEATADEDVGMLNVGIRAQLRSTLDQTGVADEDKVSPIGLFLGDANGPVTARVEFEWVKCSGDEIPVDIELPGGEAPVEEVPEEETPVEETPEEEAPGVEVPEEEAPGVEVPEEETPVEETPEEEAPGMEVPEEEAPVEETPEETPEEEAPVEEAPEVEDPSVVPEP